MRSDQMQFQPQTTQDHEENTTQHRRKLLEERIAYSLCKLGKSDCQPLDNLLRHLQYLESFAAVHLILPTSPSPLILSTHRGLPRVCFIKETADASLVKR